VPNFTYRARNTRGEVITGVIEAPSNDTVAEQLFAKGYVPVRIEEARKQQPYSSRLFSGIKAEDLIVFSRQLSTLVTAGISFVRCLDTLAEQTGNAKLKSAITEIRREVEGGSSFSASLARFPDIFSPLYVNMIRVGEEGGVLDDILDRLSTLLEHEAETRARIKTATRYPVIVVFALVVAFFMLTGFVIPKFAAMYASSKVALPWPTQVLIFLNQAVTRFWPLMIAAAAGISFGFRAYIRTLSGKLHWDMFQLRVPVFGPIAAKTAMSRFARIFSTLYRSGIPMLHALDIVSGTIGNMVIEKAVENLKESVREGKGLAQPMSKAKVFPPMVVQMTAVGEETGALDQMLNKVSAYYDVEVDYAIRNLSTAIEPILLVFIGGAILFLALGIFLPMWDMINVLKR
jgi:type II secretory pathway component PulF